MPETELVTTHTDDSDRTFYEPVVATVVGFSEYNKDQFRLVGPDGPINGWWNLMPSLTKKGLGTPQKGTRALWHLSTKPKTGEKAKPGSVYYDVVEVERVPESYTEKPYQKASATDQKSYSDDRTASIVQQVAFKALTDLLAAGRLRMWSDDTPSLTSTLTSWGMEWVAFYEELKRGRQPVWPEEPETLKAEPPASAAPASVDDLPWGNEEKK